MALTAGLVPRPGYTFAMRPGYTPCDSLFLFLYLLFCIVMNGKFWNHMLEIFFEMRDFAWNGAFG